MTVAEKRVMMGRGRAALKVIDTPGDVGGDSKEVDGFQPAPKKRMTGDQEMVPIHVMQITPERRPLRRGAVSDDSVPFYKRALVIQPRPPPRRGSVKNQFRSTSPSSRRPTT